MFTAYNGPVRLNDLLQASIFFKAEDPENSSVAGQKNFTKKVKLRLAAITPTARLGERGTDVREQRGLPSRSTSTFVLFCKVAWGKKAIPYRIMQSR